MISTLIPPQKVKVNSKLKVKVLESEITKVLLAINLLPNILKKPPPLRGKIPRLRRPELLLAEEFSSSLAPLALKHWRRLKIRGTSILVTRWVCEGEQDQWWWRAAAQAGLDGHLGVQLRDDEEEEELLPRLVWMVTGCHSAACSPLILPLPSLASWWYWFLV